VGAGQTNRIVFLGTGTSSGIPVVGCSCPACLSTDPRDNRTRISALLQTLGPGDADWRSVLLDTSIDLRQQLLREKSPLVTEVVYTHAHVDHFFGLDELRGIQFATGRAIEIYAARNVLESLKRVYGHLFDESIQKGGGILSVRLHEIQDRFAAGPLELLPIPILHGDLPILGYRWGDLAYLTDCSGIPDSSWPLLQELDVLVLGMLRKKPHPTHFNLDQALAVVDRLKPRFTYFIHMTHDLVHAEIEKELPEGVHLAFDGLRVDLHDFDPVRW
jgi:phosphoribosyl 1,2-cyclic phosphate phosphodiesterase